LVFSEANQQIHCLNDTAAALISLLSEGASRAQLCSGLAAAGLEQGTGEEWIQALLRDLARLRLLEARLPCERSAPFRQEIQLGGVGIELRYSSRQLFRLIGAAYAHLVGPVQTELTYEVTERDDFVLIGESEDAEVVERELAAIRLKGLVLESVLDRASYIAALHAACLTMDDEAVLLLGSPGAGKTTLALALIREGFRYGSDDVTLVTGGATVCGLALAPAVKKGAWDAAARLGHDLSSAPVHLRPDGQEVCFAPMSNEVIARPARVSAVLRLERACGSSAELKPIGATAALAELFREARSPDGRCSTEAFQALSAVVGGARCFALQYAEAEEAAGLIRHLKRAP
jgi:hypothetical protein